MKYYLLWNSVSDGIYCQMEEFDTVERLENRLNILSEQYKHAKEGNFYAEAFLGKRLNLVERQRVTEWRVEE